MSSANFLFFIVFSQLLLLCPTALRLGTTAIPGLIRQGIGHWTTREALGAFFHSWSTLLSSCEALTPKPLVKHCLVIRDSAVWLFEICLPYLTIFWCHFWTCKKRILKFGTFHLEKLLNMSKKIIWNLNDSSPPHIKTHGWSRSFRKSMEVIFLMICPTPNWHLTNSWRFQKQKWYVNFGQSAINIAMIWNLQLQNSILSNLCWKLY